MGGGSFGIQNCDLEMWGKAQNYAHNNPKITPIKITHMTQSSCHILTTNSGDFRLNAP